MMVKWVQTAWRGRGTMLTGNGGEVMRGVEWEVGRREGRSPPPMRNTQPLSPAKQATSSMLGRLSSESKRSTLPHPNSPERSTPPDASMRMAESEELNSLALEVEALKASRPPLISPPLPCPSLPCPACDLRSPHLTSPPLSSPPVPSLPSTPLPPLPSCSLPPLFPHSPLSPSTRQLLMPALPSSRLPRPTRSDSTRSADRPTRWRCSLCRLPATAWGR